MVLPGNLANLGGLRARLSLKHSISDHNDDEEECRPWRRRLSMAFTWRSALKITLLLLLLAAAVTACFTLPIEKILKDFLLWVHEDLGAWGPLVLSIAYIPLTVLAVPASILTLGGGYLFGLPVGFVADSIGATVGAGAAFLLGRTIGKSFVVSKLKDYPQFHSVAIAINRSGFKIVLLLRLVPLLPFNMLNYLLSVTPVSLGEYMLASWLGMMDSGDSLRWLKRNLLGRKKAGRHLPSIHNIGPCGIGFRKEGTVPEGFSDIDLHAVVLAYCVTRVAKAALEKALAENGDGVDYLGLSSQLPIVDESPVDLNQPLIIKIDSPQVDDRKRKRTSTKGNPRHPFFIPYFQMAFENVKVHVVIFHFGFVCLQSASLVAIAAVQLVLLASQQSAFIKDELILSLVLQLNLFACNDDRQLLSPQS
ncbi:TVP38/TMEM64 family membrane protein slr0305-like [Cucumis melo var. makuwa]|uniref:TVP38/TMEM64 family membrane protein slr0305-like n=1 Tax=Cucumis melo var. makuwa TaxID=1194695 RepID=A0A5A7SW85_CUCMM|nr:TVP38/TMEM64 family membrane protein slr0305-like [Cucumis melo var. makuwa]